MKFSVPVKAVSVGDTLIADDSFYCIKAGCEYVVCELVYDDGDNRLYIPCNAGNHFLDSMLDEFGNYVGFILKRVVN